MRQVGIFSSLRRPQLLEKSGRAIDKAFSVIRDMSQRVDKVIDELDKRPDRVEVQFGIKFDGEVGVVIAKASMEASLNVTLSWESMK